MNDEKLLGILEFDKILEAVCDCAVSEPTKRAIVETNPSDDYKEVQILQAQTKEAYIIKTKYLLSPIVQFDDITEFLNKAKAGAVLHSGELIRVAGVLRAARIAKKDIEGTGEDIVLLKQLTASIYADRNLENQIGDCIANDGTIKDDASDALKTIRRKIFTANAKLKEKLASYTRSGETSKYLQDNIVTVRMGRFVLPVKSECRGAVPGLIHDQSSSGSTVFIEPYPVVELNNELKYLQLEEQREIERILLQLTEYVANAYDALNMCMSMCVMLDIVFAKLDYSLKIDAREPILNDRGKIILKGARHPLIARERIVPVNVAVGADYKMLIVTGPNTGGKTVCLKTVGLCCLMAASGLWIPCETGSEISVFDRIFCDLGDEQSIEHSLSTFSAHIVNVISITNNITPKSLVLMDELGSGTDPVEGAALSLGIIKFLEMVGAVGVITTHFDELKEYALVSDKLMNACMQFDEQTLKPTYKLIVGIPGVSNALKIAGTLGLNDFILQQARQSISQDKIRFEQVLKNAEAAKFEAEALSETLKAERAQLNSEREQLLAVREELNRKLERINGNAKAETRRIVGNMLLQADELMDELKNKLAQEDERALLEARRIAKRLSDIQPGDDDDVAMPEYEPLNKDGIKIGATVIVKSVRAQGIVRSLPDRKNHVTVQIGSVRTSVAADDLASPKLKPQPKKAPRKPIIPTENKTESASAEEVMVLGMTVSEAIEVIDPYLNACGGRILRIVHGKGTGRLGKGIQNYLRTNPCVKSYRYGGYGEGDSGVTVCELK